MPSRLSESAQPLGASGEGNGTGGRYATLGATSREMGGTFWTPFFLWLFSLLAFWPTIVRLAQVSLRHEQYSYLPAIPLISAVLIYFRKNEIFRAIACWPAGGGPLLAAGALLGFAASSDTLAGDIGLSIAGLALALVWVGIFVLCYGREAGKRARFALIFLMLTAPLPTSVLDQVAMGLQHASATTSYVLFRLLGVPVLSKGVNLSLPGVDIEIAKECSGIRSSISLLLTSSLAGYLFLRTGMTRFWLIVLTLPVTILKNSVRIVTLSYLGIYVSRDFFLGSLHRKGGVVFAILGLILIVPAIYALRSWENRRQPRSRGAVINAMPDTHSSRIKPNSSMGRE